MELIEFKHDPSLIIQFVEYPINLYKDDTNWIPPFEKDMVNLFNEKYYVYNSNQNLVNNFIVMNDGIIAGRATAYINRKLKDKTGCSIGTIGFFECDNNFDIAKYILKNAIRWFSDNGVKTIHGPIDFDIWHRYRFMTKGFAGETFLGEPYNKEYYPVFFEKFGFRPVKYWDTLEVHGKENIAGIISRGKSRIESLIEKGYRFEYFDKSDFNDGLKKLHFLIHRSFYRFIDFQEISFENFKELFSILEEIIIPEFFTFAYHPKGELVGFSAGFPEISGAVKSMNGNLNIVSKIRFLRNKNNYDRILCHLIGMIPGPLTEQSGLGRALIYSVVNNIIDAGYEKVIFSMTSRNNASQGLLSGYASESQKEYALYELKI